MKRTTFKRGNVYRLSSFFRGKGKILILILICLAGYLAGLLVCKADREGRVWRLMFEMFCGPREANGYGRVFLRSFFFSLVFVLLSFISGLSLAGIPFVFILLAARGFFCGVLTASAMSADFFGGLCFFAVIILVPAFLSVAVLILACREALSFSTYLVRSLSFGSGGLMNDFKVYCTRFLVIIVLAALSSGVDSVVSMLFYRLLS